MCNESANIDLLCRELVETLEASGRSFEIIVVDGSTDDSFAKLAAWQAKDSRLRIIRFRRNFIDGGVCRRVRIRGAAPASSRRTAISRTTRVTSRHAGAPGGGARHRLRLAQEPAGRVLHAAPAIDDRQPVDLVGHGSEPARLRLPLKVFRAEVVKPLKLYGEMHRFLPAIASEMGVSIVETVVNHRPRRHGPIELSAVAHRRVMLDLLTVKFLLSYSTKPLQIFGLIGGAMGLVGLFATGWLVPAPVRLPVHSQPPAASSAFCSSSRASS